MNNPQHILAAAALTLASALPAAAQETVILSEGFNDLGALSNWSFVNDSTPVGQSWFQGNSSIFPAQAGPANSYAAANYLSAGGGTGTISNWLITPVLDFLGASNLSFFARSAPSAGINDTMEILFSSGTGLGDFTVIGIVGGLNPFPDAWQEFSASIDYTGSGRFAFRYTGDAAASNYIGLDTVNITTVPEPSAWLMLLGGLGGLALLRRKYTR